MDFKKEIGFLFDLDGVLINSCEFHWQSWDLLQREVVDFKTTKEEFLKTFGKRNDEIFYEKIPSITPQRVDSLSERKEELFRQCAENKIQLIDGMEDFLKELEKRKVKKIIASSTPQSNLNFFLKKTVLGDYFSDYVAGDQVAKGKPAPDIFLKAAEKLDLPISQCVVLEDSPAGLQSGFDSGAFVIALATTHLGKNLTNYHLLFDGPHQLNLDKIGASERR